IARIPPKSVSSNDKDRLANLERDLKLVIFGQDNAVETLASCIKLSRSGLGNPDKPIGNFLLAGPTGVGKTELAKALADFLFDDEHAMVRIDMSE
ncbi:AAA family ATPase, partial [Glaesserella parasuis]|uniref:AAA family ATPase n=1 Tax=Glaesserella parasuis TaxID=738 RepID=UPI003B810779